MANTTIPLLANLIESASSNQQYAEYLRNVKNYITGHELRKKQYIQAGLIPELAAALERASTQNQAQESTTSEVDEIWIQVANIVCVLAHGGPTFVHPILHSTLVTHLISRLAYLRPSKILLVVLNALNAIADNLPLSTPDTWNFDGRLAEQLYTKEHGTIFTLLLTPQRNIASQQVFETAAALICKTCITEQHKAILIKHGVLDALCTVLASFVVEQGLVIPHQPPLVPMKPSWMDEFPSSVRSSAQLSATMEAIAVLVENSKEHSLKFLTSPPIRMVLPNDFDEAAISQSRSSPWINFPVSAVATPLDLLLPSVPDNVKSDSKDRSSFPPLGTSVTTTRKRQTQLRSGLSHPTILHTEDPLDLRDEYLIVPWLLYIVRSNRGRQRLVASRLLTVLYSHGWVHAARARTFGALLIPVLIRMLEDQSQPNDGISNLLTHMHYTKAVPAVLASLIMDNTEMQRIAFEAKAIPKLAVALRSTFEQNEEHDTRLWVPTKQPDVHQSNSPAHELGWGGPLLSARHVMTFREGLLRALAAIAPSDDIYRKEICDQGVLVQIMLALEPFQSQISKQQNHHHSLSTSGNSTSTLLAACNAVRALTRSVTALRTRLVDADVGKAIMRLMYNSDPEVRIAATKVIANLAMDFSPLKATISEPDLIKKLCEQAHSANARLRLESIWALKLLVLNAPNKVKRDVVDELGPNWIKHLIETDPYDIPPGVVIGLSERDYPPRTLHEAESNSDDVLMDEGFETESSTIGMQSDLADPVEDYNKHTVEDDLAIQEQLIDLIRNLFCGETASEIVDYLLGEIGTDTFMKVLIDRLKPRLISDTKNQISKPSSLRGIVVKVLYVIVHIAACAPNFRNLISKNSTLMRSVARFCNHDDPEIRAQCCWIVINLTYEDNPSDREACRLRALEINKIGFHGLMRRLESDPEPNVRERAKTAFHLLEKML